MKIHYISCHSVLEYDEVQLLTDLGHEVFSNGAYSDPAGHFTLPRPAIQGARLYKNYLALSRDYPKTALPDELIEPFDAIIIMHTPEVVYQNWQLFEKWIARGRRVIWRTIGQSTPGIENTMQGYRNLGLEIVRYSPKEQNIAGFAGEDAMIRFYKDPDVYNGWIGDDVRAVNFTQSLKGRHKFVHHDTIAPLIKEFGGVVYGTGNDDMGSLNGGEVTFEKSLDIMRHARVAVYAGTWPASYTLTFIEYLMLGIPIVAISKKLAHIPELEQIDFYEVDELLAMIGGCVADDLEGMRQHIMRLTTDYSFAQDISKKQRELAIQLFGKTSIASQWKEFLNG